MTPSFCDDFLFDMNNKIKKKKNITFLIFQIVIVSKRQLVEMLS